MCPDLKWFSFQIADTISNLDHLQPNLFSTIWNPYFWGFQTSLYLISEQIVEF